MNIFIQPILKISLLLSLSLFLLPQMSQAQSCLCDGRMTRVVFQYSDTAEGGKNLTIYDDRYGNSQIFSFPNIQQGDYVVIESSDIGLARFGPKIFLSTDGGINLAEIHTSCSENIVGNTYINFTAVSFVDYQGNECSVPEFVFPVEWASMDITSIEQTVVLNWATFSEQNNERFEIERSVDQQQYEVIGTVSGAGNSEEVQEYRFADETAYQLSSQRVFYRLKQVDFNGNTDYSDVLSWELLSNADLAISAFPNPVSDVLHLQISARKGELLLMNINGQTLQTYQLQEDMHADLMKIEVASLPAGPYILRLTDENVRKIVTRKILVY